MTNPRGYKPSHGGIVHQPVRTPVEEFVENAVVLRYVSVHVGPETSADHFLGHLQSLSASSERRTHNGLTA